MITAASKSGWRRLYATLTGVMPKGGLEPSPATDFLRRAEEVAEAGLAGDGEALSLYWRVIDAVDPTTVMKLQGRHAELFASFAPGHICKYADLPFWLAHNVVLARQLGLDGGAKRAILDIGMGAGHFAAVCQALGHTVVGTDVSVPLYEEICAVLKVDRRIAPTRRRAPLPDLGARFDLVTIVRQVFHIVSYGTDGVREHWSTDDWAFFLDDLVRNHLRDPGTIFLKLNPNVTPGGLALDAALMRWCESHGAKVAPGAGRILFEGIAGPGWLTADNAFATSAGA